MLHDILEALTFFAPAYFANTFACILGGGKPLDFRKKFIDGRRVLGDGVTVKGSVLGGGVGVIVGIVKSILENSFTLHEIELSFLLSYGAILGDALGSFLKRRLNIPRGRPAPLLDQLDFVMGALFLASFIEEIEMKTIIILLLITPFGHLLVNMTGYKLGMKDVPW